MGARLGYSEWSMTGLQIAPELSATNMSRDETKELGEDRCLINSPTLKFFTLF